ncbi:MAG: hypothetical protein ACRC0G_16385 [Fusobacteriaceae bacterium]
MKYKVGDKVRIVNSSNLILPTSHTSDKIYEITKIYNHQFVDLDSEILVNEERLREIKESEYLSIEIKKINNQLLDMTWQYIRLMASDKNTISFEANISSFELDIECYCVRDIECEWLSVKPMRIGDSLWSVSGNSWYGTVRFEKTN